MKNIYLGILFVLISAQVFGQCCSNGINLLANYNPDFSAPFTDIPPGFTTENPYTTFPTPGTYIIVASRDYGACFNSPQTDHTTGDPINGRFLWFDTGDASPTNPDTAWRPFNPNLPPGQESLIAVQPNTTYVFSCWIRDLARNPDCFSGGAPLMGLRINGQEMAEVDLGLYTEPCCPQWTYLCAEWNSGSNAFASIQIESRRSDGFNDLGIDDVYFGTTTEELQFSLGQDTAFCEGQTLFIDDNAANSINLWSDSTTADSIQITSPGIYWLEITINNCKARDTILVTQDLLPSIDLGNDTLFCDATPFTISPQNSGGSITSYLWQDNSSTPTYLATSSGMFSLTASNTCGAVSDSIEITLFQAPNLGPDLQTCSGELITLSAGLADSYIWSTGAISNSITVDTSGLYWVETTLSSCSGADTIEISYFTPPLIDLGADTLICANASINLSAQPAESYEWSTGDTSSVLAVSESGTYWVLASNGPCISGDTISMTLVANPDLDLGGDVSLCEGELITLTAGSAETYVWADGSTDASRVVGNPGLYWVEGTNENCSDRDSIIITVVNCTCSFALAIPNAFSPNNDGFNDVFIPQKSECIEESNVRILNRWGSEVYFSSALNVGWDGRSQNSEVPDGTYFWIVEYTTFTKEKGTITGFVDLRRK